MTEEDLERFHDGDPAFFRVLIETYGPLVWSCCLPHVRDLDGAEDLYQDAWIRVWLKRRSYQGRGSFQGWLFRLTSNHARSHLRSEARRVAGRARLSEGLEGHQSAPHPPPTVSGRIQAIHLAVAQLPTRQREALSLVLMDSLPTRDAAEMMGVSPATVRSLLRHALNHLRSRLEETETPPDKLSRRDGVG